MRLSSLLISRDDQEISVLECILSSLHISVDVEPEPSRAWDKLAKSKIDALIVDSDLEGSEGFLCVRQNGLLRNSVPLVILGAPGRDRMSEAKETTFFFEKPISVAQAVRVLSAARNMILEGRLRYHRQKLHVPVCINTGTKRVKAQAINLSQSGIGIQASEPLLWDGPLQLSFALPGAKPEFQFQGELVWSSPQGHAGIRFIDPCPDIHRDLRLWVERQFFAS